MSKNWKDQLNKVLKDNDQDGIFGTNIIWDVKDIRRYITKLEKLGIKDIEIKDCETIKFTLTCSTNDCLILLHILTTSPMPREITHDKKKNKLCLWWG